MVDEDEGYGDDDDGEWVDHGCINNSGGGRSYQSSLEADEWVVGERSTWASGPSQNVLGSTSSPFQRHPAKHRLIQ